MAEPTIARRGPYVLDVKPGTVWWCACGLSKNQPLCDGSHRGTEFSPIRVEITEPGRIALCGCKRSANGHLCDGTHSRL